MDQRFFEESRNQLEQRMNLLSMGIRRTGVKVKTLDTESLIELYYSIFNPGENKLESGIINDNIKLESNMKKLFHAKLANLNAAKMCNHKRTIPKNFDQTLQKKKDTLHNVEKTKPWKKSEESLKKTQGKITKTEKQKEMQRKRIKK